MTVIAVYYNFLFMMCVVKLLLTECLTNCCTEDAGTEVEDSGESRWQKLICGCLDNLPPVPSNIVRIFISSTFSGKIGAYSMCQVFENHIDVC